MVVIWLLSSCLILNFWEIEISQTIIIIIFVIIDGYLNDEWKMTEM